MTNINLKLERLKMFNDKIIVPCDWKTINLMKVTYADDFGEALREYCFVGNSNQIGCYSTFELLECFKQIKSGKIFNEAKEHLYEDVKPTVYHYKLEEKDCYMNCNFGSGKVKMFEPTEIVVGWTWDGDGCLYFRYKNRSVVNSDCKKSYNWKWIKK